MDVFDKLQLPLLVDDLCVVWRGVTIHGAEGQPANEPEEQHVEDTRDGWRRGLQDVTSTERKG